MPFATNALPAKELNLAFIFYLYYGLTSVVFGRHIALFFVGKTIKG